MRKLYLLLCLLPGMGNVHAQSLFWTTACTDEVFCYDQGSCNEGAAVMTQRASTSCSGGRITYLYRLDLNADGSIEETASSDSCIGTYPSGTHRITWRATDNCGNVISCSYLFTVRDCSPPNMICINGLTQNIDQPNCDATFFVDQFVASASDNCTDEQDLEFGMRRQGDGDGFPGERELVFEKCEQGFNPIEIWVRDENGLTNSCSSYIIVQPSPGSGCDCIVDADLAVNGCAQTSAGQKLDDYRISHHLYSAPGAAPDFDEASVHIPQDSCFSDTITGVPFGGDYTLEVRAFRPDLHINGVSTFDMVTISKHILGIEPFDNVYQFIAADVNNSGSASTFDIVEIRRLILGIYDTFPAVPSWRFFRPVADPSDLFQVPDMKDTYQVQLSNVLADTSLSGFEFVGVKMGDVNQSATLQNDKTDDRTVGEWRLQVAQRQEGRLVYADVLASELVASGWQMALGLDLANVELLDVKGISPENWRLDADGNLRLIQFDALEKVYGEGDRLFTLVLQPRFDGPATSVVELLPEVLTPEVYSPEGLRSIVLDRQLSEADVRIVPNPAGPRSARIIGLPEGTFTLDCFDALGRLVWSGKVEGGADIDFPVTQLSGQGTYLVRLTGNGVDQRLRLVWLGE